MHHRYDKSNIPIELLRTLVAISEAGSFTKAADALKLSQSAVSAQIKRLEQIVAAELFAKAGGGHRLTERGLTIAAYAARILALNDQILALAGSDPKNRHIRLGLPGGVDQELLVTLIEELAPARSGETIYFRSEENDALLRDLAQGRVDVAFIMDPNPRPTVAAVEWTDQLQWVRSPKFLLSPGAAVPLVSGPGSLSDRAAMRAFDGAGIPYFVAFASHDRGLRKAAVAAGVGVMVAAERSVIAANLNIARDHYLPPLGSVLSGIFVREGFDVTRIKRMMSILEAVLKPSAPKPAPSKLPERTRSKGH
jgi:molybdate transport repressor ModE-like protein